MSQDKSEYTEFRNFIKLRCELAPDVVTEKEIAGFHLN